MQTYTQKKKKQEERVGHTYLRKEKEKKLCVNVSHKVQPRRHDALHVHHNQLLCFFLVLLRLRAEDAGVRRNGLSLPVVAHLAMIMRFDGHAHSDIVHFFLRLGSLEPHNAQLCALQPVRRGLV
jgi:hypothetical protein